MHSSKHFESARRGALNYDRKVRGGAGELFRREGIAFIPVGAESLGGRHPTAVDQLRRLARGVATKKGEEESSP